ncbi:hypothetical protein HPB52_005263 [Rhipicephalus sanguineus]|uniref:THAP-type domain-containing protein n=1 Tax=Rhipicephalus sanguineus TaxID=34632 RepID=A0A9D4PU99_RHISA|nr:hypothetical protein HPB52_005263 [Rhipicephalus sanguineus]
MPQYCAAYVCCNTFGRDEIDLHKFPRDQKMAAKWVTGVKRKDFKPTRGSVLCSKHFHDSDYVRSPSLMQSLGLTIKNSDAIPSVFPHLRGASRRTLPVGTRFLVPHHRRWQHLRSSFLQWRPARHVTATTRRFQQKKRKTRHRLLECAVSCLHNSVDDATELRPITGGGETRNAGRGACCSFSAK